MTSQIVQGNALDVLATLPEASVQMCVTSPPYWSLRDYGVQPTIFGGAADCDHKWKGAGAGAGYTSQKRWQHTERGDGSTSDPINRAEAPSAWGEISQGSTCTKCGAWLGCLGLEPTPELYVEHIAAIFDQVRRVLRDDGTLWLTLGDCYAAGGRGGDTGKSPRGDVAHKAAPGVKAKDLVGIPWMVAFALRARGWYLRSDIIWAKTNPMPESIGDRPTKSHEYVFLLAKSESYFYDGESIREGVTGNAHGRGSGVHPKSQPRGRVKANASFSAAIRSVVSSRNRRSVWTLSTAPFPGAHFACVDNATEALTRYGWKSQQELRDGDEIAAYDIASHTIVWQPATIHRYDSAPMLAVEKRDLSMRLTPNHRCLVRARTKRGYAVKVVEASELNTRHQILTSAPFVDDATSGIGLEWASLVGWYIAEGHSRANGRVDIYQSHTANPINVVEIRNLLTSVNAEFVERRRARTWRGRKADYTVFTVTGAAADRLQRHGGVRSKSLNPGLVFLPADEATALLRALVAGDGHTRPDGRRCFIQKSKVCADLAQVLGVRLGLRAIVSKRKGGDYSVHFTSGGWLTLRGTNGKSDRPVSTASGPVWCPSVESTFWLARRAGRTFITGNTFPPKLVEPCILAGTSEHGACSLCGAPFRRVVKRGEPLTDQMARAGANADGGYTGEATKAFDGTGAQNASAVKARILAGMRERITIGWAPTCDHTLREIVPCVVLDPFAGSGTTGMVAAKLGRSFVGIELNPDYIAMATDRIGSVAPSGSAVPA